MFITGLGTALPSRRYTQVECWDALQVWERFHQLRPRSRKILEKILLGEGGIVSRHFVLGSLSEGLIHTPDVMRARFETHAPALAAEAAAKALRAAGVSPQELDGVIISTCTGYLCPGLTSYVAERMGLRRDVIALDLVGQGCGAALPNLRAGEALIRAGHARQVLSICVEICSAAIYIDDDPGVLVSACLFGDGAGAAVVSRDASPGFRPIRWREAGSTLEPAKRDLLRFEQKEGMLRNILTRPVPGLAAHHARQVFGDVTARAKVQAGEIAQWLFHAGGREVLAELQGEFCLNNDELQHSVAVLRAMGNISSPFILHVLERALQFKAPAGLWWLGTFGAGFSSHGALLEVS